MTDQTAVQALADPPLLTGGSHHRNRGLQAGIEGGCQSQPPTYKRRTVGLGELISAHVDFLTLTVESEGPSFDRLMAETEHHEAGDARAGFASSERRKCLGGLCWRRMEPHQPSKWAGGLGYESWEWDGDTACVASTQCRGLRVRPSRVDVAFDFSVTSELTATAFVDRVARIHGQPKLVEGIAGEGGINTHYFGAKTSDLRLRIYRKDLQDPGFEFFGPTMRVEIVLRGEKSQRWWQTWRSGVDQGKHAAATMISEVLGFELLDQQREVQLPEAVKPEGANLAASVHQMLLQYGDLQADLEAAGVNLGALARIRKDFSSRWASQRSRSRCEELKKIGAAKLEHLVLHMLGRKLSPEEPESPYKRLQQFLTHRNPSPDGPDVE